MYTACWFVAGLVFFVAGVIALVRSTHQPHEFDRPTRHVKPRSGLSTFTFVVFLFGAALVCIGVGAFTGGNS